MANSDPRVEVVALGGLGTMLIFVSGIVYAAVGAAPFAPAEASTLANAAALVAFFLTLLLGLFLYKYWNADESGSLVGWSTMVVIVGAFSFWIGGGFVVGTLLTVIAGGLGILLAQMPQGATDSEHATPVRAGPTPAASASPPQPPPPASSPIGIANVGTVVWFCMKCDGINRVEATVCTKCGAPRGTPA